MQKMEDIKNSITEIQHLLAQKTQNRLDNLTKPQGSLGRLEELAKLVVAITANETPDFKNKVSVYFALAIFNSKYIDYLYRLKVLETDRVFPQVKLGYLHDLPFVTGTKSQQEKVSELTKKMIALNKDFRDAPEDSNEWNTIKFEIEKIDRRIDEEIYKLYGLTPEEVAIVEGEYTKN